MEVRKTEVAALVENKLTIAEQKRELELKKKLEIAKKHVNITNVVVFSKPKYSNLYAYQFFACIENLE